MRPLLALLLAAVLLSVVPAARADAPPPGCFGDAEFGPWLIHCGEDGTTVFCTLEIGDARSTTTLIYALASGQTPPPSGRIIVRSAGLIVPNADLVLSRGSTFPMTVRHRSDFDDTATQNMLVMGAHEAAGIFSVGNLIDLSIDHSKTTIWRLGIGGNAYSYTFASDDLTRAIDRTSKCFHNGGN